MNKMLFGPLIILFFVAVLAQAGLSPQNFGSYRYMNAGEEGWYDSTGHAVAYENGTVVSGGENGHLDNNIFTNKWYWVNGTIPTPQVTQPYSSTGPGVTFGFNFFSNIGLFAIITAIMALAVIMGVRILNSGMAGETIKIVVFGTALSGIWMVLSVPAFNLITSIPLIGFIAYAVLTIMFGLGAINQISGGGGDDL